VTEDGEARGLARSASHQNAKDDYRLFDTVLLDAVGTPAPRPGSEYRMVLRGRAGAAYQAATALSNPGIPLGDGRAVPLGLDNLAVVSATNLLPGLSKSYRGTLDGNGDGRISIALPNLPALTDVTGRPTARGRLVAKHHSCSRSYPEER
jgi:hypothetical protein